MMKKTAIMIMGLLIIAVLAGGCNEEEKAANQVRSVKTKEGNNQAVIAKKEFTAKNSSELSSHDFETAYELGKTFLRDYYYAKKDGSPQIDFSTYMANHNLLIYSKERFAADHRDLDIKELSIGLDHARFIHDENAFYFFYTIVTTHSLGEFGEAAEILVSNVDGKLVISDWYTPHSKVGFDARFRPNAVINNPDIWDDEEYVHRIFEKAGIHS